MKNIVKLAFSGLEVADANVSGNAKPPLACIDIETTVLAAPILAVRAQGFVH
jgi:hypothetical protein